MDYFYFSLSNIYLKWHLRLYLFQITFTVRLKNSPLLILFLTIFSPCVVPFSNYRVQVLTYDHCFGSRSLNNCPCVFPCPQKQLQLIVPKFKLLAPLKELRRCQSRLCKSSSRRQWEAAGRVQLSHEFHEQTSNNKWYNAMAQERDNPTIFFDRTACSSSSLSVTQPLYIAPTRSQCTVLRAKVF